MTRGRCIALGLLLAVSVATAARARNTMLDLAVADAKKSPRAVNLLDVPFYMAGEKHPKVKQDLGEFSSNQRTSGAFRSDDAACQIAFLSAIIQLQKRANAQGGNAVIDVRSITRNENLSSATQYRCAAGAMVANVALTGHIVKLATK